MEVIRTQSDNENRNPYRLNKDPCAGLNCNKIGMYRLKIIYIDKTGLFCNNCKTELEKCGLVSKSFYNRGGD